MNEICKLILIIHLKMDKKQIELDKSSVCEPKYDNEEAYIEYSDKTRHTFELSKFANEKLNS